MNYFATAHKDLSLIGRIILLIKTNSCLNKYFPRLYVI